MFFSTELLSRRDSGFGLLWLAATLGSKSSFKKLPKRSILTADIAQLCGLIAEPEEPLALRLSSNLMVGVARVYKGSTHFSSRCHIIIRPTISTVKQEIFLTDVTTCFQSLRKAVLEIQSLSAAQLQMGQPSVRPDAITLSFDPNASFSMNFDPFIANWDDYDDMRAPNSDARDDDYGSSSKKAKGKSKPKCSVGAEEGRGDLHILSDYREDFFSTSFDVSFLAGGVDGGGPSSSQLDGGLGFDFGDVAFRAEDLLEFGGDIGYELARELGEGWGVPAEDDLRHDQRMDVDLQLDFGFDDPGMGIEMDGEFGGDGPLAEGEPPEGSLGQINQGNAENTNSRKRKQVDSDKENLPPSSVAPSITPRSALSPNPFQAQEPNLPPPTPSEAPTQDRESEAEPKAPRKKSKRVRLLLDPRTELDDDELKACAAREKYLEDQDALRYELEARRAEKMGGKMIEDLIWGVPRGLEAPALADLWTENFKVQVEARSGALYIDIDGERPRKRRKEAIQGAEVEPEQDQLVENRIDDWDMNRAMLMGEMDMDLGMVDMGAEMGDLQDPEFGVFRSRVPSSQEPEQARRASRQPSAMGSYLGRNGPQTPMVGSQRSSILPWANVGPSSSVGGVGFSLGMDGDLADIDHADIGLIGSQRGSQVQSRVGSVAGGIGGTPMSLGKVGSQISGQDFEFPADVIEGMESQLSEVNADTLERNSRNFLAWATEQSEQLTRGEVLTFDHLVPKDTSSHHVAASGFYHCLGVYPTSRDLTP
ncbi:hypothetical protein JAAARDRAFT_189121 [Jaapia argillacea MUCL 33604]|uniref:Rad21/Rec8-like protein N-terminal domain-containing protein n=1 Tax=Jaapia argillacea MUCL 33604 TaxID=933084 RepID=A0A067Q932_9AGAM|nr:hypothetical protein JAAARDRAFT_189121 [Jaapia argillacea MUCL 33604]